MKRTKTGVQLTFAEIDAMGEALYCAVQHLEKGNKKVAKQGVDLVLMCLSACMPGVKE